jgi:hypothetical protein
MQARVHYRIEIAVKEPNRFAGAPLSVEIIPPTGLAQRALVPVSAGPVLQEVGGPGYYVVRARLPSGRLISQTVSVPETANLQGDALAKVVLDLQEHDAITDFWRAEPIRHIATAAIETGRGTGQEPTALGPLLETIDHVSAIPSMVRRTDAQDVVADSGDSQTTPEAIGYDWGTFVRWEPADVGRTAGQILRSVLRRGGSGTMGPRGEISPPSIVGGTRIEPLMIVISELSLGAPSIIAWLPHRNGHPAIVGLDLDRAAHRSGSELLAFAEHGDPIAATLYSYIRQGALQEARTGLPALRAMLASIETQPEPHPDRELLAAYVLYKLGLAEAASLISRLRTQYPHIPDLHVLEASQLIAEGQAEQAKAPLEAAYAAGVPIYSEGVRLLRSVSNFFRDLYPADQHCRHNAGLASRIAAAANLNSELTCLRVGDDLAFEFETG